MVECFPDGVVRMEEERLNCALCACFLKLVRRVGRMRSFGSEFYYLSIW